LLGYLSEIGDNASGTIYWTANARDAELPFSTKAYREPAPGLAIVRDIAKLYGGKLELGESPLGGLEAKLTLPAIA